MAFQPCPNIAQIEMIAGLEGQVIENVFHHDRTAAWTSADLNTIATHYMQEWRDQIVPHLSTAYTLLRVVATDLSTSSSPRISVAAVGATSGGDSGARQANNVALAIKQDTGLRGRSQRGRTFLGGLTTNSIGDSQVTAAFQALIIPALNLFLTNVNALTLGHMCVLSRFHNGVPRANGVGTAVSSFILADGFSDSQRRRLPAHNRHR